MKLPFPWFLKYALLLIARYTVCLLSGHRWFYGDYKVFHSKRVCFRCRECQIADSSPKFRAKVLAMRERDPEPWPLFKDTKPEDLWLN